MIKKKNKTTSKEGFKQFDKLLRILLLIGIIVISGFILYALFNPEPGYVTLGILNSDKKAEDYPTQANIGENISFYVTVGNYMKREFQFSLEILKGNEDTTLNSTGSYNAESFFNTTKEILAHSDTWISNMLNVSFSQPGANQSIIVELWELISSDTRKYIDMVYIKSLEILP